MSHELTYFLKVNIAIMLFYAFYRLFFYRDTFFKWRRTALLCFFMVSMVYPILNIQDWIKEQEPMVAMADIYSTVILPEISLDLSAESPRTDWRHLIVSSLQYIYWGVVALLLARFFVQLLSIIRLGFRTSTTKLQNTTVHLLNKPQGPFSFFGWIFIYPDMHTENELEEILTHEQTHASQWHSADVLCCELICIFCWFNPFVWLMKREVRNNLEFLADHKVLETGHDSKAYQYHLLGLTYKKKVATLYNSFNVLPLKIRIRMMNKKRTKQIGRTKYLLFLPLAALLLIVSNIEAIARGTEKLIDNVILPEEKYDVMVTDTIVPAYQPVEVKAQDNDVVFEIVEQMPEFPGGNSELMKFLAKNIKFSIEAQKKRLTGRVIAQFVVSKNGDITNPKIIRSVCPELDGEALRVIGLMPKWKPGMQRGKAVNVKYTIPVVFRLYPSSDNDKIDDGDKSVVVVGYDPDFVPQKAETFNDSPTDVVTDVLEYNAQVIETRADDIVYEIVEQMPEFPGGGSELMKFLSQNIWYPKAAAEKKIQGRVIAQFIVNEEGDIVSPKIIRSIDPELDAEALRVIGEMPKWQPGKQRGKNVAVRYTVPVMFRLNLDDKKQQGTTPKEKVEDYGEHQIDGETVYNTADEMPEFPGGSMAMANFISKEMKIPEVARVNGVQGRVIVQFVVDKDGSIKYPVVRRLVDPVLDKEALRIVESMPKWKPGKINGQVVATKYTLPIMFRL